MNQPEFLPGTMIQRTKLNCWVLQDVEPGFSERQQLSLALVEVGDVALVIYHREIDDLRLGRWLWVVCHNTVGWVPALGWSVVNGARHAEAVLACTAQGG